MVVVVGYKYMYIGNPDSRAAESLYMYTTPCIYMYTETSPDRPNFKMV